MLIQIKNKDQQKSQKICQHLVAIHHPLIKEWLILKEALKAIKQISGGIKIIS